LLDQLQLISTGDIDLPSERIFGGSPDKYQRSELSAENKWSRKKNLMNYQPPLNISLRRLRDFERISMDGRARLPEILQGKKAGDS